MPRFPPSSTVLLPLRLGPDGARRAYTLISLQRPGLSLEDWLREVSADLATADHPLFEDDRGACPESAIVGLMGESRCLFAVFGYRIGRTAAGARIVRARGPAVASLSLDGLIRPALEETFDRLTARLDCERLVLDDW